jgi:hypothetical protein
MAKADGTHLKELTRIEKQDALISNGFGVQLLDNQIHALLFDIIEDRHGKRTTIITSRVPVKNRHEVISEKTLADAILVRIVHQSIRIELYGESVRKKLKLKSEKNNIVNKSERKLSLYSFYKTLVLYHFFNPIFKAQILRFLKSFFRRSNLAEFHTKHTHMKFIILFFTLVSSASFAQTKSAKSGSSSNVSTSSKTGKGVITIMVNNEPIYLTTNIDYNIAGLYENLNGDFDNVTRTKSKEPITQLNADGTGLWQNYGTSKVRMNWGIECEKDGSPKKNESPSGAVYRLWYQIQERFVLINSVTGKVIRESGVIGSWDIVEFSINFNLNRFAILGDRVKNF